MKGIMRKFLFALLAVVMLMSTACGYGAVASHTGKLFVARNDLFLFGALRTIYVCAEAVGGKMVCKEVAKP